MKKLLVTLSIVLLMFMFVGCSGDNPAPGNPDTGTDEPATPVDPDPEPEPEPEPEAREFVQLFDTNYKWVGIREDDENREHKIELVPFTPGWETVAFNTAYNNWMGGYSTTYMRDYLEQVFDLETWRDYKSAINSYHFYVNYYDEYEVMNAETMEYDYYPYYIRFIIGFDLSTPDASKAKPYVYNRFIYSTYTNVDPSTSYDERLDFILVPAGTEEQNKIFTDTVIQQEMEAWYETIFKGMWAGQNSVGVGMVNLLEGAADNPEKIEFTYDNEIPDVDGGGFGEVPPVYLYNLGELTREPISQN